MTDPTLQDVIDDIVRNRNAESAPAANRDLLSDLSACFDGYPIRDCTDLDDDRSHHFVIVVACGSAEKFVGSLGEETALLRRLQEHAYVLIWLCLSVVAPYYIVGLMRRELRDNGEIVESYVLPQTDEQTALLHKAHGFAGDHGYVCVPSEYLEQAVPGIEMERGDTGKATVFTCLFADEEYLPLAPSQISWIAYPPP
jgi:hypothetical protein